MLKKLFIPVAVITALFVCSANAQWKFVKYFPDDTTSFSTGMNNTIAADPTGKVWIVPYAGNTDSIVTGTGTSYCWDIYVYNPDGTLYKKYGPILNFNGTPDTLYTAASGYGMTHDAEGNIVIVKNSLTIRKIDYKTGNELAKAGSPIPGYASSMDCPMLDAADEVFTTSVVPTSGVGPVALSSDFSSALISIDTSMYGAYSRNVSVTPDGNDVYIHHIGLGTFHYHSDNGTLGPYVFVDTLFQDLVIETSAWRPGTKELYVGSGNVTSGMPNAPYRGYAWYGFDMTNPDSPVLKDSILWNGVYDSLLTSDPRPRGIAFSPGGDTVYVGAFNANPGFCQMLVYTGVVGVNKSPQVAMSYSLSQNYPNPFNPSTMINYTLKSNVYVTLKVYDVLGRNVATLVDARQSAGQHSATFDGSRFASGVYLYSIATSDGFNMVKKMIMMKQKR